MTLSLRKEEAGAESAVAPTRRATLVGGLAVLLWAALALLGSGTARIPSFELVALAFAIAFSLAVAKWLWLGESFGAHLKQPATAWAVGVGGLFGYHALYFLALKHAPAVEVSLIAYLWPLLIVVFSALLPGERVRWWHVAGALTGLAGTALIITGGGMVAFRAENALGYAAALACALTWSSYSVLSRRMREVPTDAVGGFCLGTALLALLCHLAVERWVWPTSAEWGFVFALGLGPVGAAFFVWDYGVKHGSIKALGGFSYASPLLSTLLLMVFGRAAPTSALVLACFCIVAGAVLASRELWQPSAAVPAE